MEEAAIPLPSEETTPPVTKTNLVMTPPGAPPRDAARARGPPACRRRVIRTRQRPDEPKSRSTALEAARAAPPAREDTDRASRDRGAFRADRRGLRRGGGAPG